jgi:FKBP-type peptidyl-prolyl cis-trans isomerase SlyD
MADKKRIVADDLVVSLDYTLRLDSGQVVDSSTDREPLEFLQGHHQIIPGLEQALYGMGVGETKAVVVSPEEGYGQVNDAAYQEFPKDAFPPDVELEAGMGMELVDGSGRPLLAFVSEIRSDSVLLDFNHPLAGETLHFDVEIANLRAATEEELSHGHVHGDQNTH